MLENDFADSRITVRRTDLLEKLKANREKHVSDFKDAWEGFLKEVEVGLEKNLALVRDQRKPVLSLALTVPCDHTKDYDRVILMMEMSTKDEIIISESQFTQFVMDEWNWKAQFTSTTQQYSNKR